MDVLGLTLMIPLLPFYAERMGASPAQVGWLIGIYAACQRFVDHGVTINRPPRDGHMAFVRSPDGISVELLQNGHLEPAEPWVSMPNTGAW